MIVPNKFPRYETHRRVALIGEAPGADEERTGEPFVGMSGRFLAALLSKVGLSRDSCFLGNVCQHRPPQNDLSAFAWNGLQVQHGLTELKKNLDRFKPNVVVLLGNVPLRAAKDPFNQAPINSKGFVHKNSVMRGYMFLGELGGPFEGYKCLSTLHPAYCLRDYGQTPLLALDLKRAFKESESPTLVFPDEKVFVPSCFEEACLHLRSLRGFVEALGTDIEGYVHRLDCIAFAPNPNSAIVIPFTHTDNRRWWTAEQDCILFRLLAELLEDPNVSFIWQNGLYDRFVLQYGHRIRVRNNHSDIMLKHWELNSEMAKGDNNADRRKKGLNLNFQASIYLKRPFWKGDRSSNDDATFLQYNGRDAMATKEIDMVLDGCLTARCSKEHYRMNVELLNPLLYMELVGIRYNVDEAKERRELLQKQLYEAQARLNKMTHRGLGKADLVFSLARHIMGYKRATIESWDDLCNNCTKPYVASAYRLRDLMKQLNPSLVTIGEIEDLLELSLNVGSNPQMCDYLYREQGLPVQYNKDANDNPVETADYEALLNLSKLLQQSSDSRLPIIHLLVEIRALATRQEMLSISADRDGRIRCGYNIVGSNTGRVTCYKSPTGSGYNLQTIPNYTNKTDAPGGVLGDRDLFMADDEYWFFQCDLAGADGWTVAAYAAMLGDRTMLDDYLYGLKPAQILVLMLRGTQGVDFSDRDSIKTAIKTHVKKEDWDYFACKRVQHGCAYLEGGQTVAKNILTDSEGKLYLEPREVNRIKDDCFFARYPGILRWHEWVGRRLKERPILTAASGQIREFHGRPDEIITKAVAFEPQANTTYATNLAMQRLWKDNENRYARPSSNFLDSRNMLSGSFLRIQPLHQVHDALCGQFPKRDTAWASDRIKSYFANPIKIAGHDITIPYEGAYGTDWAMSHAVSCDLKKPCSCGQSERRL